MVLETDVVVVGGGHAGIEAALAADRMGCSVALVTLRLDRIGELSCNPAVGGSGKSHIVREVDVLGGRMGRLADAQGIQFRRLNRRKGPAVWALRVQCPLTGYREAARRAMEASGCLLVEDEVIGCIVEAGRVGGVRLASGRELSCRALVVTTGTFLRGRCHVGDRQERAGRYGEAPADGLSASLAALGLMTGRLKTGTPPRLDRDSIDWTAFTEQPHEADAGLFSYFSPPLDPARPFRSCHLGYTNERTHEVIRASLHRSPLYTGAISGPGPRYCPSIEDKVVRFADRQRHQIFLEPVDLDGAVIYPNGISTSLPEDVQEAFVRTIRGLEEVRFVRPGYAVEYDFVPPTQLRPTLETRVLPGLYLAGQINGTTGYEEAAGQGLWAGANAAAALQGRPPFVLDRAEAYLGVMVDDLVTRGVDEPYRMMTARAEYRLCLRHDNAYRRLMDKARSYNLLSEEDYGRLEERRRRFEERMGAARRRIFPTESVQRVLGELGQAPLRGPVHLGELLARPGIRLEDLDRLDRAGSEAADPSARPFVPEDPEEAQEVEISWRFAGYVQRQRREIERFRRLEARPIPEDFDYDAVPGLSSEAREKLSRARPLSLGQAGRVPGVTPAALSLLSLYLTAVERRRGGEEGSSRDRRP